MTDQDLAGRRAVVTGGASGIGLACAQEFARRGAHVVIADLNGDAARAAASGVGGEAWVVDLADTAALESLTLDADILVNNAGIQKVAPIHEFEPATFRLIVRLMLESPFLLIRAALPTMYERGWGRIINISSVNGEKGQAGQTNYSAAKAGMHGFSMALAQELASKGVTVNTVSPGYIGTDMVKAVRADVLEKIVATIPVKRLGEPSEIASICAWLASEESGYSTGAEFSVNGGLHMN